MRHLRCVAVEQCGTSRSFEKTAFSHREKTWTSWWPSAWNGAIQWRTQNIWQGTHKKEQRASTGAPFIPNFTDIGQLIALKDSNNRYPSHSLRREILIKSSGLENDEGRALNKSKSLAEVARTFKLAEDIIGRNRKTHLKRNFEETEDNKEEEWYFTVSFYEQVEILDLIIGRCNSTFKKYTKRVQRKVWAGECDVPVPLNLMISSMTTQVYIRFLQMNLFRWCSNELWGLQLFLTSHSLIFLGTVRGGKN